MSLSGESQASRHAWPAVALGLLLALASGAAGWLGWWRWGDPSAFMLWAGIPIGLVIAGGSLLLPAD